MVGIWCPHFLATSQTGFILHHGLPEIHLFFFFFLQPEHVSDKLDLREWLGMLCIQGKKEIHDEYYIYPPELKRPPVSSECKTCCCTILAPAKLSSIVRVPLHKHWRKIVSIFIRLIFAYLPWVVMQMDEFKYLSNVYFYHKIEIFVSRHSFSVFFFSYKYILLTDSTRGQLFSLHINENSVKKNRYW